MSNDEDAARAFLQGGGKVKAHDDQKAELIPPDRKLDNQERAMFGADAVRCPATGWPYERGSGALSKEQQTAEFIRRIAADKARPEAIPVSEFTTRPLGAPKTDKQWSYEK